MKGGSNTGGFTIMETLIVLAVTGIIFLSAAMLISGKTAKTEFSQAIQSVQSQIQQTIGEVESGYYPNSGNFSCQAVNGGSLTLTFGGSGTEQGANQGCIFLGKVMKFNPTTDPEKVDIYTMIGIQRATDGQEVNSLSAAKAVLLTPGETVHTTYHSEQQSITLPYGLSTYTGPGAPKQQAVGFINSLGQSSGGQLASGTQQVTLLPLALSSSRPIDEIDSCLGSITAACSPPAPVTLCFASGTTNQSGLITIGSSGRALSVDLKIFGTRTCS